MSGGDEGQNIEIGGDANSSTIVSGDRATITITNYYYREDTQIEAVASANIDLPCPYRGLFHFGPDDADFFYGRDVFVAELLTATQIRNFIPILGASGSGKSSVVLAGLVPKLKQLGHWRFTHFRPGADPFHALALSLIPLYTNNLNATEQLAQARQLATYLHDGTIPLADVFTKIQQNYPQDRVLLIADQFEELYTLCNDEKIRRSFLDVLLSKFQSLSANSQFSPILVSTMRADFLGNALSYPPFADVLRSADIKIRSMNRIELSEVIEKPAQKLGVTFESGLVERILDDVENQPGNLPLLEFALTELWKQQMGKQLTHATYQEIGEIDGALAKYADAEYAKLNEIDREQVRRIFIQLVRPGENREDTRRLTTQEELGKISWDLVSNLATARLVVTSQNSEKENTVEVVHETLVRNWGMLRQWMETDRTFRSWQERLRSIVIQWEETNQDEGLLLRGVALAEAEEKLKERPEDLSVERELIEQSIKERDRQKQEIEQRRQRDFKISRGITVGSCIGVLVASGFGIAAWQQSQQAEINLAGVMGLSASILNTSGKELDALVLGLRAGKIFQKHGLDKREKPAQILSKTINDRNQNFSTVQDTLEKTLLNVREKNRLIGHFSPISMMGFDLNGKAITTGSLDLEVKRWDTVTGELLRTLSLAECKRDTDCGKIIASSIKARSVIPSCLLNPKDRAIKIVSKDNKTVKFLNTATGKPLHSKDLEIPIGSVAFSPNCQIFSSAGEKDLSNFEFGYASNAIWGFLHKPSKRGNKQIYIPGLADFREN
jgi:hypothetical protein